MKRLSIIVPLYNSEKYLPKCLDSLLNQDIPHDEYEIILVNDGSPDGSKQLAEEYAKCNPNIIVLSQQNKGTSGARNTGILQATGQYLYFVDPDDYILENSLCVLLDKMDRDRLDILRFGYREVDEQYQPTKSCKHPEQPDYSPQIMDGCSFLAKRLGIACYVWTFIFKTSLIKDNDIYFLEGDYFDDTPWLPRVFQKAKRVDSIDYYRHFYLIRVNSLVQANNPGSIEKKIEGQVFLIKELSQQRNSTNNLPARKWYQRMLAHCAISLLNMVGIHRFSIRKQYLNILQSNAVLPLSWSMASAINKCKVFLINISPDLYCRLIHFMSN